MNADADTPAAPCSPAWEVAEIRIAGDFFRGLNLLLPLPAFLSFEGTSIEADVWEFLKSAAVPTKLKIPAGTIWPKPRNIHVLATASFLTDLAGLTERHAEPEICDHFHAYNETTLLLQWYDAFFDPIILDRSIPESAVRQFAGKLGVEYRPYAFR